jgi:hypothetical protein
VKYPNNYPNAQAREAIDCAQREAREMGHPAVAETKKRAWPPSVSGPGVRSAGQLQVTAGPSLDELEFGD